MATRPSGDSAGVETNVKSGSSSTAAATWPAAASSPLRGSSATSRNEPLCLPRSPRRSGRRPCAWSCRRGRRRRRSSPGAGSAPGGPAPAAPRSRRSPPARGGAAPRATSAPSPPLRSALLALGGAARPPPRPGMWMRRFMPQKRKPPRRSNSSSTPSMNRPEPPISAGMIVSAESITASTARGGAERHAVHEAEPEQQQAEQRDHDGDRGEHDGPPGRVDRLLDRQRRGRGRPAPRLGSG